jgi:hypothetical protein
VFLLLKEGLVIRMVKDLRQSTGVANCFSDHPRGGDHEEGASRHAGDTSEPIEKPGGRKLVQQLQTYEITFLGQAGSTLRAEFEDCEVIIGRGTTTLRTELPDRGALSGLMARINGLGLDVIDVSLVASPPRR